MKIGSIDPTHGDTLAGGTGVAASAAATAAATAHAQETSAAHPASAISIDDGTVRYWPMLALTSVSPGAGYFASDNVEGALQELGAHVVDTSDAHDASAISIADAGGYYAGADVEAALQELGTGASGDAYDLGSTLSGAVTVDRANGTWQHGTLAGNVTLTFSAVTSGKDLGFTLELTQDATGGRTVTWPGSVTWLGGSEPTHDTTAGTATLWAFLTRDGGTTWLGGMLGAGGGGGTPATTVESETTFGIAAAVGTATEYARQDHTHGTPANPVTAAAVSALGFVGELLISDTPSTPLVFADIVQTEAQDDLVYAG